MKLIG
jgi:hypothetical protein